MTGIDCGHGKLELAMTEIQALWNSNKISKIVLELAKY